MEQEEEPKHPGGRPRIEISIEDVEKLAMIGATTEEIADFYGCSLRTIMQRMEDDEEFSHAYRRGLSHMRMSLRRHMLKNSQEGNVGSQIWLSKQYLNMSEPTQRVEKKIDANLHVDAVKATPEQLQVSLVKKFEAAGWKMIPPPEEKKDNNDGSGS